MTKRTVLLVDDNRDVLNWGCRATSISLHQILSKQYKVSHVITKTTVDTPLPISEVFPLNSEYIAFILRNVKNKYINEIIRIFHIKKDFIAENPKQSLDSCLKFRRRIPLLDEIYSKVNSVDMVVINGEGSMIFTSPPRRDLLFQLFIIELSSYLNKPTYYLNAMVSDCPVHGRNESTAKIAGECLKKCKGISVRDPYSLKVLKEIAPDINPTYIPDALFSWIKYIDSDIQLPKCGDFLIPYPEDERFFGKFDFTSPYICVGGSSLAAWYPKESTQAYAKLVDKLKTMGIKLYLIQTCDGDSFLDQVSEKTDVPIIPTRTSILIGAAILSKATVFISGRYHPSILASLGGTPCIFLGSNSHKTLSLQDVLNYQDPTEYPAIPTHDSCEGILLRVKEILNNENSLRETIRETSLLRAEKTNEIIDLINMASMEHYED